uniref:Methyltransferase domain-containing protein n=1 Tax=Kwoniella dejecticola CBS 10117 TaxID=1296121 RepID=A0A1A6AA04_9TREE|nr:uncharacterized protein I303_02908 [Kwoniella dejecticola CBS 10117]OBR86887.1 hypothetical protein I303_02908 [Kwoniella dejecticola CBS 10117]
MPALFDKILRPNSSIGHSLSERDRINASYALHKTILDPYHTQVINTHLHNIHLSQRRTSVLDVGTGTGKFWFYALILYSDLRETH